MDSLWFLIFILLEQSYNAPAIYASYRFIIARTHFRLRQMALSERHWCRPDESTEEMRSAAVSVQVIPPGVVLRKFE